MSFLDGYTPPTDAELAETNRRVLSGLHEERRWDPRTDVDDSGFERPGEDLGSPEEQRQGADRAEARETRWLGGES